MAIIKGTSVILYDKKLIGKDAFNKDIYEEVETAIENVLISPVNSTDIKDNTDLNGKKIEYELSIPKGDTNIWEDRKVCFYGKEWHTVGFVQEYMENLIPLAWNKKIKVERYG